MYSRRTRKFISHQLIKYDVGKIKHHQHCGQRTKFVAKSQKFSSSDAFFLSHQPLSQLYFGFVAKIGLVKLRAANGPSFLNSTIFFGRSFVRVSSNKIDYTCCVSMIKDLARANHLLNLSGSTRRYS